MPSKNPPATLVGLEGFGSNESRRRIQDVGWRDDRIEALEEALEKYGIHKSVACKLEWREDENSPIQPPKCRCGLAAVLGDERGRDGG